MIVIQTNPKPSPPPGDHRFQFSLRTLMIFTSICVVLCSAVAAVLYVVDRMQWQRDPDPTPAWAIDPAKPWKIELGRGSGLDGLDAVVLDEKGQAIVYRIQRSANGPPIREKATLALPSQAVADVLAAVAREGLMTMYKGYHARNVADGTQWVLLIKQGGKTKSVYFDNYFPREIKDFAAALDSILAAHGMGSANWSPTRDNYERELWESITCGRTKQVVLPLGSVTASTAGKLIYLPHHFYERVALSLRRLTGQEFGTDKKCWSDWWNGHRATFRFPSDIPAAEDE